MSTENTNRNVFGFHGIFGVLLSIVGLIFIWAVLMTYALLSQREATKKPYSDYYIRDGKTIEMISQGNKNYAFPDPKSIEKK